MTAFCALQGVPLLGSVPIVCLSLKNFRLQWNGKSIDCPAQTVLVLEATCNQVCELQVESLGLAWKFRACKEQLHKDMWFRSCDASVMPFRSRCIAALKEHNPRILWTIGDMIYADFFVPALGKSCSRYDYCRAWCHTLGPLTDILIQCVNFLVPDDHEIWDNWSTLDEGNCHGFDLLQDLYLGLMGKWRAAKTRLLPVIGDPHIRPSVPINAYDSYCFLAGKGSVMFVVLATSIHDMTSYLVRQATDHAEAKDIKLLVVVSNKPRLTSRVSLPNTIYSCCMGAPEPDDAAPLLFHTLHCLALERPGLKVTFIGGDYHVGLQTRLGQVKVIITSPFSGVTLPGNDRSEYLLPIDAQKQWIRDMNFYSLKRDELVRVPLSSWEHWHGRSAIVGAKMYPCWTI